MANAPLPSNQRAVNVQSYSLASCLAALSCAGGLVLVALFGAFVNYKVKYFQSITQPRRKSAARFPGRSQTLSASRVFTAFAVSYDRSMLKDHGLEAVFFDQYLRFVTHLFGLAALVLTPAVASYNSFVGGIEGSGLDELDRLGWSNLSSRKTGHYWFYTGLVLCFAMYAQIMVVQELQRAFSMKSQMVTDGGTGCNSEYYVAARGLPEKLRTEADIRTMLEKWCHHIHHITILRKSSKLTELQERKRQCVRAIERHESAFVSRMVRRMEQNPSGFSDVLRKEVMQRYYPSPVPMPSALSFFRYAVPDAWRSAPSLYDELLQLSQSLSVISTESQPATASAILALSDCDVAKALSQSSVCISHPGVELHYLGNCPSQILVANVLRNPTVSNLTEEAISFVRAALIALWTIPMGASGILNQLSAAKYLFQEASSFHLPAYVVGILQGVVPQLTTSCLMLLMVALLNMLTSLERNLSMINEQKSMNSCYSWFLFSQLFFTTSISSGLIPTALNMLNQGVAQLPRTLAQNLPLASTYFLSYLPLQASSGLTLAVLRIPAVLIYMIKHSRWQSPRDRLQARASRYSHISWGVMYPLPTTLTSIVIIYALISPLILPVAALSATISRIGYRYSMIYDAAVTVDTQGELFFDSLFSVFWGLLTMELAFIGLFLLKIDQRHLGQDIAQLAVLALTLYATLRYWNFLRKRYQGVIVKHKGTIIRCKPSSEEGSSRFLSEPRSQSGWDDQQIEPSTVPDDIIWIARDNIGVSDAVVSAARERYFGRHPGDEGITNSCAVVNLGGHLTISHTYTEK